MCDDWKNLKSLNEAILRIENMAAEKDRLQIILKQTEKELQLKAKLLYEAREQELHIKEILRLATYHFTRLRNQKKLTDVDYAELEKWIRRAKSNDGLKSIVEALQEMSKFQPYDIKSNLYALIQKIIIEGPKRKTV